MQWAFQEEDQFNRGRGQGMEGAQGRLHLKDGKVDGVWGVQEQP
jgi:hypothetical protein